MGSSNNTGGSRTAAPRGSDDLFAPPYKQAKTKRRRKAEERSYSQLSMVRKIINDGYNREHPRHKGSAPDGVCHCGEPLFTGNNGIYVNDQGEYYHEHMRCNSWACPVCAPRKNVLRQAEIQEAILAAHRAGDKLLFLTFTIPHWADDTCLYTRRTIQDAYTKMGRRRRLTRILQEHGYAGQIRCWDFTYGSNGWHPHIHAIYFFETEEDPLQLSIRISKEVEQAWAEQVETTSGRKISRRHGFLCEPIVLDIPQTATLSETHGANDPETPRQAAGEPICAPISDNPEYVLDNGETADTEREAADRLAWYFAKKISVYATEVDKGGRQSKSPFEFIVPATHPRYEEYSRIFYDYYKGQKGIRRIRMSPGLRERYGIEKREHERPEQLLVATAQTHHIRFLSELENSRKFQGTMNIFGIRAALDWLDNRSRDALKQRIEAEDDTSSKYRLADLEANPNKWAVARQEENINALSAATLDDTGKRYDFDFREIATPEEHRDDSEKATTGSSGWRSTTMEKYHKELQRLDELNRAAPIYDRPISGVQWAFIGVRPPDPVLDGSCDRASPFDPVLADDFWF